MAEIRVAEKPVAKGPYMRVVEVAEAFDISVPHAFRLVAEGRIPSLRTGRRISVPRCWVESRVAAVMRGEAVRI